MKSHPKDKFQLLGLSQNEKAPLIKCQDSQKSYKKVGFVTILDKDDTIQGGILLYDLKSDSIFQTWVGTPRVPEYPYIAGGLSLRYKKCFMEAISSFIDDIDLLIIYPSSGIQHPRFFGLASEIGLELSVSSIGLTKKPLIGEKELESEWSIKPNIIACEVYWQDRKVAIFLRTHENINGLYVSPGHNISIETTANIVAGLMKYRIPEPLRALRKLIQNHVPKEVILNEGRKEK